MGCASSKQIETLTRRVESFCETLDQKIETLGQKIETVDKNVKDTLEILTIYITSRNQHDSEIENRFLIKKNDVALPDLMKHHLIIKGKFL